MQNNKNHLVILIAAIVLSFFLGFKAGTFYENTSSSSTATLNSKTETVPASSEHEDFKTREQKPAVTHTQEQNNNAIPEKVYTVLKYIREHNEAPDGYVGGRTFSNRERILPQFDDNHQKIKYQEWDVNPKEHGKNRGVERLVTSSKKAYYTNNHYKSFQEVYE